MGDYQFAFATPGFFHIAWADNCDDVPGGAPRKDPNMYYDKIPLGLSVVSSDPACGSFVVSTAPTDFIINLSDPVVPATVEATDFTVNGTPADSFTLSNGNATITFSFTTTPVVQGENTMHIPAGAFNRASDNQPKSSSCAHSVLAKRSSR